MQATAYFVFQEKTVFIPLRYVYPECSLLIQNYPKVHPLLCLKSDCPANRNCMETLAKRVFYFFQNVEPKAQLMLAYFKDGDSIRAGVFYPDMDNSRVILLNRSAFTKFQGKSLVKHWTPTSEYINIHGTVPLPSIITPDQLLKKNG